MRPSESFIGQPIRSLQTMLRVLGEDCPDYDRVIPDGIYGPETVKAVSSFQRIHGLPVTGVTNQQTWEAITAEYEPALVRRDAAQPLRVILNPGQVLTKGQRHPHLSIAQAILMMLSEVWGSIPAPGVTGILDNGTADALTAFQQLTGLPATGNLDKHTWKYLALHYPLAARVWDTMED